MKSASISGSLSLAGATSAKIQSNSGTLAEVDAANPSDSFGPTTVSPGGCIKLDARRGNGGACSGSGTLDNTDASGSVQARLDRAGGADEVLATAGPGQTGVAFSYSLMEDDKVQIEAV